MSTTYIVKELRVFLYMLCHGFEPVFSYLECVIFATKPFYFGKLSKNLRLKEERIPYERTSEKE